MSRIFVYIAAYRDAECEPTIQDLFERAANPDAIFIGVCWQFFSGIDDGLLPLNTRPEQVRVMHVDAKDARGSGWPRLKAQELWQGEEYVLQIDSHMRVEQDWDIKLIDQLSRTGSKKAVLTGYPPPYLPPRELGSNERHIMLPSVFNENGILVFHGTSAGDNNSVPAPALGMFCSGGFLFGPSSLLQEVPYDPYLYFYGEEIVYSVRLWTHGYDIYHPCENVIYHYYKKPNDETNRTHWADNATGWSALNTLSIARVHYLLSGIVPEQADALADIEIYGLGTVRSIADYEAAAGVDFKQKTISDAVKQGDYSTAAPYRI